MDETVVRALAKWPNVPACYGWLHLDARGQWRIGAGRELVRHAGLADFIARNYLAGADGAWYFQNGPQRVFVSLETAPLILRRSAPGRWATQIGAPVQRIDAAWMDETGLPWLMTEHGPASVDDRDLAAFAELLDGLDTLGDQPPQLTLHCAGKMLPVTPLARDQAPAILGFVARPTPP